MALPVQLVKCSVFFESLGKGWSESFWYKGLSNDLGLHSAWLQVYCTNRLKMLPKQANIHAYRVSFDTDAAGNPISGDSVLRYLDQPGTYGGSSTAAAKQGDDPNTALLVTNRNALRTHRRNVFIRSIPREINVAGGVYDNSVAEFQTAFATWRDYLLASASGVKDGRAGWIHRAKINQDITVTGYTFTADGRVIFALAPAVTFTNPPFIGKQHVRIQGLNVSSTLNGDELVDVAADGLTATTVKPIAAGPFKSSGKMFFYSLSFDEALDYDGQKIVERKVGAPLLEQRGRAKAKPRT